MAAISNHQETNWKQAAMQRAEKITDYWDIVKAYAGRSAEVVLSVCMFVSIIGVLPGVHYWPFVNNVILSVQIIMLDMGGFALNTMAEHARDNGQEGAARKAEKMGAFLIGLVIATLALITIGQLAVIAGPYAKLVKTIVDYAETSLILVRVVSTVQYIHVIHSLRSSTLSIHPTQVPTQQEQEQRIEALTETVNKLAEQVKTMGEISQPTQTSLQATQVVEEPTHHLYTIMSSLKLLGQIASSTPSEDETIQDETTIEADTKPVEQVLYPSVPGVSSEKVKQVIDAHLNGVKWRDIAGNYSQTIRPIREVWESLHTSIQVPTQPIQPIQTPTQKAR